MSIIIICFLTLKLFFLILTLLILFIWVLFIDTSIKCLLSIHYIIGTVPRDGLYSIQHDRIHRAWGKEGQDKNKETLSVCARDED